IKQDQTPNASAIERRVTFFVQSHKESNQRKGFGLFRIKSHECGAFAGRSRSGHPAHGGTRRTSMCAALRVSLVSRVTSGAQPKPSRAKQSKAKQSQARQGKAKQGKAKQGKAKQGQAEQGKGQISPFLQEASTRPHRVK
ncbi:hypothetical protein, partial [Lysobacter sp. ISL-54]|uniref:hypothetical protein n=1 Tax=Lysobacter sp. ISL-54 TaxID=2819155 RepID=UPI001BEC078C